MSIKKYKYKDGVGYEVSVHFCPVKNKKVQCKKRFFPDGSKQRINSLPKAKRAELYFFSKLKEKYSNDSRKIKFSSYHEVFLKKAKMKYKNSTYLRYDKELKRWLNSEFTEKYISEIRPSEIHDLIFTFIKNLGATSGVMLKVKKCLQRVFEDALEEGIVSRNPVKGIKISKIYNLQSGLNQSELRNFLTQAKLQCHKFYYLWAFALYTGMRNGELYALTWRDVDLERKTITVNRSWTFRDGLHGTKSGLSRPVPISPALYDVILDLKRLGPYKEQLRSQIGKTEFCDDLVLPRHNTWRNGDQSVETKNFLTKIGLRPVRFHDLRASFITQLLCNGVTTPKVMIVAGHAKLSTTDLYLRLAGLDVSGVTDSLRYDANFK
jgi:integrase